MNKHGWYFRGAHIARRNWHFKGPVQETAHLKWWSADMRQWV